MQVFVISWLYKVYGVVRCNGALRYYQISHEHELADGPMESFPFVFCYVFDVCVCACALVLASVIYWNYHSTTKSLHQQHCLICIVGEPLTILVEQMPDGMVLLSTSAANYKQMAESSLLVPNLSSTEV
eukprot:scaffold92078_cov56-Cyclotella_meneghiniana.AAC.2